jgi:phage tail sheath protein FI
MPIYLTPGVYFETVDASREAIAAIRTDIAAFVGISERGPLSTPVRVSSWKQFQSSFGSFIAQGYLAYTVKAFFENGGRTCYVVRVAATRSTTEDAGQPQPADRLSSLVFSTDGFATGDLVRVRQDISPDLTKRAVQMDHVLSNVDGATGTLFWEQALEADFQTGDPVNPLQFQTGALPAFGVLLDETGAPTLLVEASSPGSWGNTLSVRVSRSSNAATRTTSGVQPTDGLSAFVESIVGISEGTLVKIFQAQQPVSQTAYRAIKSVDPVRNLLTWETVLDPAFVLNDPLQPLFFETHEFSLTVYVKGHPRENFSGLSLTQVTAQSSAFDEDKKRAYIEDAVNVPVFADEEKKNRFTFSNLIRVTDLNKNLAVPPPWPDRLPDPSASNLARGRLHLQGGRDGLSGLRVEDFTGDVSLDEQWGLRSLEEVDEVSSVAVPDILIQPVPPVELAPQPPPEIDPCLPCKPEPVAELPAPTVFEQPPVFSLEDVFTVQQALVAHCELLRDRVALLDPPVTTRQWLVQENPAIVAEETMVLETSEIQSWRQRFDSKYAALYYPWVLVYDPLQLGNQVVRAIPPSGHVAGIYARTDTETGVHAAPANQELKWAQGLSLEVSPEVQGIFNPVGINVARTFPGRGILLYGARTVSSDPAWRYVNVRRLLMMIEEAVEESTQWAVFEPNDIYLRQTLVMAISSFLEALWERGALVGKTPEEAFFVKCDDENNPSYITDLGQLIVDVGVAPVIPAEFVVFRIGKTERGLGVAEEV